MQLRRKTLIIIGLTLISLIIILYTTARIVLLDGFMSLEQRAITQNIQRLQNTIDDQLINMSSLTADWSHWDETYFFVQGENEAYIEDNLMVETYINLGLQLMIFMDTKAEMVYGKAVDLETWEAVSLPVGLEAHLTAESPLLQHTEDPRSAVTGVIMLDDGPMLVASRAILTNTQEGPIQGTMVMGRFLNATEVEALAARLAMSVMMFPVDDADVPQRFQAAETELTQSETSILIQILDADTIAGYALQTDLDGNTALIWEVEMPRDILAQGEASLQYFLGSLVIVGLVFTIVVLLLLDRFVLARIEHLNEEVNAIRLAADFSRRIALPGQDELANFAGGMNEMLAALARAQDDLKEALQFKSQVLANVSHDARTPISVITLRAEMLESGMFGDVTEEQNKLIQSILSSSRQLLFFVNNLLDASQLEAGKLKLHNQDFAPATLLDQVESSLQPLAEKKGLALKIVDTQALPEKMYGDKERLSQIIFNLVGNAVKFTDEGEVCIEAKHEQDHEWVIRVSDTGPGIPADAQQQLFEAFYQVDGTITRKQSGGVGLGLSIVKQLVDLMGGQVNVTSELGVGSTFTVTLPYKHAQESI